MNTVKLINMLEYASVLPSHLRKTFMEEAILSLLMSLFFQVRYLPFLLLIIYYPTSSNRSSPSYYKHGGTRVVKCVAVKFNWPEFES